MRVIDHLKAATKTLFSYEIVPPVRGSATNISEIFAIIEQLLPYDPKWINVTTHASSLLYVEKSDGSIIKRVHKKRPGTMGICGVIQNKYGIDAVAYVLCQGFSQQETEDALIELNYMGIENILALKGDNLNYNRKLDEGERSNKYAVDLVKQVAKMRQGLFLGDTEYPALDFCMGVASYPEKHFEAPSMEFDLQIAKNKVDAGAQYIMTQMFFDNKKYFEYVAACRAIGINVPIIPGLKPLTNKKQLTILPNIFYVDIPSDLRNAMLAATTDEACEQVGTEWLIAQSKELKAAGVPVLHYYTLGKPKVVRDVVAAVF